jgi:hypothetical protein
MTIMELNDCCDARHGMRTRNFLDDFAGKDDGTPVNRQRRAKLHDLAHQAASVEMLDEIHTMLRAICDKLDLGPIHRIDD